MKNATRNQQGQLFMPARQQRLCNHDRMASFAGGWRLAAGNAGGDSEAVGNSLDNLK